LASARTGDTQRDTALPQADWFDVKHFPQATFEAAGFTPKGDGAYEAAGKLTIRGVTKDAVLPFTLAITGDGATAKGHLGLVRNRLRRRPGVLGRRRMGGAGGRHRLRYYRGEGREVMFGA